MLLSLNNLIVKEISGNPLTGRELLVYFKVWMRATICILSLNFSWSTYLLLQSYTEMFQGNELPTPMTIVEVGLLVLKIIIDRYRGTFIHYFCSDPGHCWGQQPCCTNECSQGVYFVDGEGEPALHFKPAPTHRHLDWPLCRSVVITSLTSHLINLKASIVRPFKSAWKCFAQHARWEGKQSAGSLSGSWSCRS